MDGVRGDKARSRAHARHQAAVARLDAAARRAPCALRAAHKALQRALAGVQVPHHPALPPPVQPASVGDADQVQAVVVAGQQLEDVQQRAGKRARHR